MNESQDQKLIAQFDKNSAEVIKVHLVGWKGQDYIDIRVWIKGEPDEADKPTIKGIRLNVELLPDLQSALRAVAEKIEGGVEIKPDDADEDGPSRESRGEEQADG